MTKVKMVGATFLAALALGAIASASASAAEGTGKWLANGEEISAKAESAVTTGTWLLLGLTFFGSVKVHVICSIKLIGTVGSVGDPSLDEVRKVEGLKAGEEKLIDCELLSAEKATCEGSLALLEAEHLPWKTVLLLESNGEIIDHFRSSGNGAPALDIRCLLNSGAWTLELCEEELLTKGLKNGIEKGVLVETTNQLAAKCEKAGAVAHNYSHGVTTLLSGGTLTVD